MQGSHSQQRHLDFWKSISNDDINSLSNESTSSCKHAARAQVSLNKKSELSIYWY